MGSAAPRTHLFVEGRRTTACGLPPERAPLRNRFAHLVDCAACQSTAAAEEAWTRIETAARAVLRAARTRRKGAA
jgi:hypothetical protein